MSLTTKFESRRARKTHTKKKTHMSSRVNDYSKWDRLKYSSSSEEEEDEDDEGGKEMEIARSGAVLEKLSLSLLRRHLFGTGWCCIIRMCSSRM